MHFETYWSHFVGLDAYWKNKLIRIGTGTVFKVTFQFCLQQILSSTMLTDSLKNTEL
mgnify:CR=1 FL=1